MCSRSAYTQIRQLIPHVAPSYLAVHLLVLVADVSKLEAVAFDELLDLQNALAHHLERPVLLQTSHHLLQLDFFHLNLG